MKLILMIIVACTALLIASLAEAGPSFDIDVRRGFRQQVRVDFTAPTVTRRKVVTRREIAKPQAVVVSVREGLRRLTLRERLQARRAANKAIRSVRVPTAEAAK